MCVDGELLNIYESRIRLFPSPSINSHPGGITYRVLVEPSIKSPFITRLPGLSLIELSNIFVCVRVDDGTPLVPAIRFVGLSR
jgi:hypothetical protein